VNETELQRKIDQIYQKLEAFKPIDPITTRFKKQMTGDFETLVLGYRFVLPQDATPQVVQTDPQPDSYSPINEWTRALIELWGYTEFEARVQAYKIEKRRTRDQAIKLLYRDFINVGQ